MLAMIAGTGRSAVFLVLPGDKSWRDAGSDVRRAREIEPEEARASLIWGCRRCPSEPARTY
jgi:hypothetical protein